MKKYCWIAVCLLICCSSLQIRGKEQAAIEERVAADSTAMVESIRSQEETDDNNVPYYEPRKVPDEVVKTLKEDKKLHYFDPQKTEPPRLNWLEQLLLALSQASRAVYVIVLTLIVAVLGILLYWFLKNNGLTFRRRNQLVAVMPDIQQEEELTSAQEYEAHISKAISAGDLRQAIRWWYLYTLFQLAGRQLITTGKEKTNTDYLRSLRETPYYKQFSMLTLGYEYVWYGGFEVSEPDFNKINQEFRSFNNEINKAW